MKTFDDYDCNPNRELCARCGLVARGLAHIGNDRLCHPDDPSAPDCYQLVTSWQDYSTTWPNVAAFLNE